MNISENVEEKLLKPIKIIKNILKTIEIAKKWKYHLKTLTTSEMLRNSWKLLKKIIKLIDNGRKSWWKIKKKIYDYFSIHIK